MFAYTLRLADDALIGSQRMGEWIASAPQIEEDVALGNIALDLLGQARALLTYAGQVEGDGRTEDDLAYLRDERDFLNAQIFELANGDFGFTIARLLVTSTYQYALYDALQSSTDETLAAVAAKAVKEVDYHRDHATQWTLRLGDGTDESHRRMQAGLDAVWPYVARAVRGRRPRRTAGRRRCRRRPVDALEPAVHGVRRRRCCARRPWTCRRRPCGTTGGRRGIHTEQMGYLLAEMQHLARSHPGATW